MFLPLHFANTEQIIIIYLAYYQMGFFFILFIIKSVFMINDLFKEGTMNSKSLNACSLKIKACLFEFHPYNDILYLVSDNPHLNVQ